MFSVDICAKMDNREKIEKNVNGIVIELGHIR